MSFSKIFQYFISGLVAGMKIGAWIMCAFLLFSGRGFASFGCLILAGFLSFIEHTLTPKEKEDKLV